MGTTAKSTIGAALLALALATAGSAFATTAAEDPLPCPEGDQGQVEVCTVPPPVEDAAAPTTAPPDQGVGPTTPPTDVEDPPASPPEDPTPAVAPEEDVETASPPPTDGAPERSTPRAAGAPARPPVAHTSGAGQVTLVATPTVVRQGRPIALVATIGDLPPGFLPGTVEFYVSDSKASDLLGTRRLGRDGTTARFVVDRPQGDFYFYYAVLVSDEDFGTPSSNDVSIEVIPGYAVDVNVTVVPADPQPGDPATANVTITRPGGGAAAFGAPPPPSGEVAVKSGGSTLASRSIGGGQASIPFTVPNAPFFVAYQGDDLYIPASSNPVIPSTPPTTAPPQDPPPAPPPVDAPDLDDPTAVVVAVTTTTTPPTTTTIPDEADPDDGDPVDDEAEDESELAAAPTGPGTDEDGELERSRFVDGIPDPIQIDWGAAHVSVNLFLALLLMLLVGIPAVIVDNTIEENYDRIVGRFAGETAAIRRAERWMQSLPDGLLLVGLSLVAGLVFSQVEGFTFDLAGLLLVLALTLAVAAVIGVHDLLRLPYLNRVAAQKASEFGVYPFGLILATVMVVVSRLADFHPGFVFGIIGSLALTEAVSRRSEAISLVIAGVGLLVTALVAWALWHPIVDEVTGPDPGYGVLFLDAFLAGLWLTCVQAVAFGFAPLRYLDGGEVRKWKGGIWFLIQGAGMFLLAQLYLHPSAGRWGALSETEMYQALSVFVVFLIAAIGFWAWFRFRPDPDGAESTESTASDEAGVSA